MVHVTGTIGPPARVVSARSITASDGKASQAIGAGMGPFSTEKVRTSTTFISNAIYPRVTVPALVAAVPVRPNGSSSLTVERTIVHETSARTSGTMNRPNGVDGPPSAPIVVTTAGIAPPTGGIGAQPTKSTLPHGPVVVSPGVIAGPRSPATTDQGITSVGLK